MCNVCVCVCVCVRGVSEDCVYVNCVRGVTMYIRLQIGFVPIFPSLQLVEITNSKLVAQESVLKLLTEQKKLFDRQAASVVGLTSSESAA